MLKSQIWAMYVAIFVSDWTGVYGTALFDILVIVFLFPPFLHWSLSNNKTIHAHYLDDVFFFLLYNFDFSVISTIYSALLLLSHTSSSIWYPNHDKGNTAADLFYDICLSHTAYLIMAWSVLIDQSLRWARLDSFVFFNFYSMSLTVCHEISHKLTSFVTGLQAF